MKRLYVFLLVCGIVLFSCAPPLYHGKPLSSALLKHQPDIPVPMNFTYAQERSRIEQFASFRLCEMTYKSGPDPKHGVSAVKDFYKRLMPKYDWRDVTKDIKSNTLIFQKDNKIDEYCSIECTKDKTGIMIDILIGNEKLIKAQ